VGTGDDIYLRVDQTGSGSAPAGGIPIIFNPEDGLYYRLTAKTVEGGDIAYQLDPTAGIAPGSAALGAWADQFARFDLRVRDAVSGGTVWTGVTQDPEHIFSYEENALATGGRRRRFLFGVRAVYRRIDGSLGYTDWLEIEVNNPNELPPAGGHVGGGITSIDFYLAPSPELDHAGILLWRSLDPDFVVDTGIAWVVGEDHDGVTLVYKGSDTFFSIPQPEGTTYWYNAVSYDNFWDGLDFTDLIIGDPISQFTQRVTPMGSPPPISEGSRSFTDHFEVFTMPPAGMTVRYAFNSTATAASGEWPGGIGSYISILINQSCVLHWIGMDASGAPTLEGIVSFIHVASGGAGNPVCGAVSVEVVSGEPGFEPINVALNCATPSNTIQYNKNSSGWTTYSTPLVLDLDTDSIQFYASAPGYADSPTDYFDNPANGGV
jgi:hypothetical protein